MTVGERIKDLRTRCGWSQTSLADKLRISKQTLYKYENGIIVNIPYDVVTEMAEIFNISPAYIFGWDDKLPDTLIDKSFYESEKAYSDKALRIARKYDQADDITRGMVDRILGEEE